MQHAAADQSVKKDYRHSIIFYSSADIHFWKSALINEVFFKLFQLQNEYFVIFETFIEKKYYVTIN